MDKNKLSQIKMRQLILSFSNTASKALQSVASKLFASSEQIPSIVVPPGEHTWSMRAQGCSPLSRTILALPRTVCAVSSRACFLGIPAFTAALASASM